GKPEATAQAITEDGWFRSGDLARRDAAGNYYIVDPAVAAQTVRECAVDVFIGVPTMYGAVLAAAKDHPEDLASLRLGVSGGSALPVELLRRFEAPSTARSSRATACPRPPRWRASTIRVRSISRARSDAPSAVRLQLVTPDGAVVPEGDEETLGEVWIRGENVMKGYWGKPEATAQAITEDGWFRSGDLARRDAAGNYYIV
ncbi:AMP-binding protein, partial [Corynebacterium diphtheriae]